VPLDEVEPAVSPLEEVELLLEVESWVLLLELEELWSFERSRGELVSLELPREGREELRPWALGRVFAESLLLIWSSDLLLLSWSSDLLRSLFWPWAVALESADVWPFGPELVVMDWSELDDELSLFIFALSDLLSEVLLELGVELELVSWLCARTPGAASARARTDSAMNLIDASTWGFVCMRRVATRPRANNARPLARKRARRTSWPWRARSTKSRPPRGNRLLRRKRNSRKATPRRTSRTRRCASRSGS
jgi:hypothetical protein